MRKLNIDFIYQDRLKQINDDLKKEYYKGKHKNKYKIEKLIQEKNKLNNYVMEDKN